MAPPFNIHRYAMLYIGVFEMVSKLNTQHINMLCNLDRAVKDYQDKLSKMKKAKVALIANEGKVEEKIDELRRCVFGDPHH